MSQGILLPALCRRFASVANSANSGVFFQSVKSSLNAAPYAHERSFHTSKPAAASLLDLQSVKTALEPEKYDRNESILWSKYKSYDLVIEPYVKRGIINNPDPNDDTKMTLDWKTMTNKLRTNTTMYRCLAHNYRPDLIRERAVEAYTAVSAAYAAGNLEDVRKYMTDAAYERMRGEIMGRQQLLGGPRSRVDWAMVTPPTPGTTSLVHGAVAINPTRQGKLHFAQWTIQFKSQQVMAAYDARGRLAAGDPTKILEVEDYWVFERPFFKGVVPRPGPRGAEWRIVAQLKPADMVKRRDPKKEAEDADENKWFGG